MKKELTINMQKNTEKIINYNEILDYQINNNLSNIIKEILEINYEIKLEENNNAIIVTNINNNKICELHINKSLYDNYSLKINKNNILYEYKIKLNKDKLNLNIKSIKFVKDNNKYNVSIYDRFNLININKKDRQVTIELEKELKLEELIKVTGNIILNDEINIIYEKISKEILFDNIKIKKSYILNHNVMQELITDLIVVKERVLEEFLTTIIKNDKKFKIRKEGNNYSLTVINSSIESLISAYFEINEQVQFVKKLEKKK